jgi:fatty-acyl-CoA synthase
MDHDAVAQAMVIAIPHPVWGERPAALVVRAPATTVDADALVAHLRERVARWWLPDVVRFVETLPTTATGKFDKRTARAQWQEKLAAEVALTVHGGQ